MRAEVDQELRKIDDLYQERCSDYAQMVSEECEGEVTKASAGKQPDRLIRTVGAGVHPVLLELLHRGNTGYIVITRRFFRQ